MNLLILGVDGFIGFHLTKGILTDKRFSVGWNIVGVDKNCQRVGGIPGSAVFKFIQKDICEDHSFIDNLIEQADIVMPLVAIATPKTYVENPMKVFRLDFEENLRIIKLCHKLGKRLIFPSTSEVYGKSTAPFNEETSDMTYGPIKYSRWIYACSKQLLDRVIFALDQESKFRFTLFRPFNWIGPYLDSLESSSEGSSRLLTQLIDDAVKKGEITLVDGGHQKRCFTDVRDGVEALKLMLLNEEKSNGKIFNVGNPWNNFSVREVAKKLILLLDVSEYLDRPVDISVKSSADFYGAGYQDVSNRVPDITSIGESLGWVPKYEFDSSLLYVLEGKSFIKGK
ncbi:MAG: bifunctional UDP-4-keto-pentose/UDP-xylose synthase [Proteobacteria bacterium]|nr:bifunctional UDP-4-keto-pentose/UDP-xylose synthase [Pseudomonadota bacterium]NBP14474.1 bifunctional UDP-4-keto-pentose/UDP-xylose synthase [bacterium]